MASKSNYEGTITATAPAGGVTAGTVVFNTSYRTLLLPLTSATSGATYTALADGCVVSAPVASGAAYAAGQSLGWSTANTNLGAIVTGTTANAHAFPIAAVASGSTTADVVIHLPRAVVVP